MAFVTKGESITLYAPDSDVSLEVAEGVKSGIEQRIHTDLTRFPDLIPPDECFVSPIVELLSKEQSVLLKQGQFKYRIKIPHCLRTQQQLSTVKVRCGDVKKKQPFQEVLSGNENAREGAWFDVDVNYIMITTNHFSVFVCSSCGDKSCNDSLVAFLFGSLNTFEEDRETYAQVKAFLCSTLYDIVDYRKVCDILIEWGNGVFRQLSLMSGYLVFFCFYIYPCTYTISRCLSKLYPSCKVLSCKIILVLYRYWNQTLERKIWYFCGAITSQLTVTTLCLRKQE